MSKFAVLLASLLTLLSAGARAQNVKNVHEAIPGRLYRAGVGDAKGAYARVPYSDATIQNLCEQGYGLVVYMYGGVKDHTVSCSKGKTEYLSMGGATTNPMPIVKRVEDALANGQKVLVHCWYGVHASNLVVSLVLKERCGLSDQNTQDIFLCGVPPGSLKGSFLENVKNLSLNKGTVGKDASLSCGAYDDLGSACTNAKTR